jgi:hypothetical protein
MSINKSYIKIPASVRKKRTEASRLKLLGLTTAFALIITICTFPASAADIDPIDIGIKTADYLLKTVTEPYPGDVGGEWVVAALSEGGFIRPENYFEVYYANLEGYLNDCGGVISTRKYAEYSKTIYGVTAAGYDAAAVAGYDLTRPLADYNTTVLQGINGPIWALIALDSGGYEIPIDSDAEVQSTRDLFLEYILSRELKDGGFAMMGQYADPDITAMALQALSKYTGREDIAAAVKRAVDRLSVIQQPDGGFKSMGDANSESVSQVIIALCRLGISINDPRFVKNGNSPLDNLMTYRNTDGSFCHLKGDGGDMTATEQAFSALAAMVNIKRAQIARRNELQRSMLFNMKTGRGLLVR